MDSVKIGRFLAALRKDKGYTQQNVADMLNISNKTVSRWEQGAGYPEVTIIPALAEIYGVTTDELLAGEARAKEDFIHGQTMERKKYFLLTGQTRFNMIYLTSMVLVITGYINVFLNFIPPLFSMLLPIIGLIILLVGYFYSVMPLKAYSDLFEIKGLFSLTQNIFRKVFLCAMIFLFTSQRVISFSLYFPSYYFPRIIALGLLVLLWFIMKSHLALIIKNGKLFNKYTSVVLGLAIIAMVVIVLINWYVVTAYGRGYDTIFSYLLVGLELIMAVVIGFLHLEQ